MENIVEPNNQFDFSKLILTHPVSIPGGAYFTKILNSNKSLYVQTIKSVTRQGIIKNGKKYYCELMFDSQSAETIHWFERLEETCQKLLFEKNDQWFQNSLEENDVETAFIPVIRIFKSGKYYLVRCNIKSSNEDQPMIKIYNENKQSMPYTDITNETNVMALLEIQGIKFTTRSFQIEIEMKQLMVLNDDAFLDNCLIKTQFKKKSKSVAINAKDEIIPEPKEPKEQLNEPKEQLNEPKEQMKEPKESNEISELNSVPEPTTPPPSVKRMIEEQNMTITPELLDIDDLADIDELKEVDNLKVEHVDVDNVVKLKQPTQVYLDLYKKAREKAKVLKRELILSFLEAKHIKEVYMIDVYDEKEYDIDAEIDAVSENELDNL